MGDKLNVDLDKFYYFVVGLGAVSETKQAVDNYARLNSAQLDAPGTLKLAHSLGFGFEAQPIPADAISSLSDQISRIPLLQQVVLEAAQELTGYDTNEAISMLAYQYNPQDGFTWKDAQHFFDLTVDIASVALLVLAIANPVPGDETLAAFLLSSRVARTVQIASTAKHSLRFAQSDKEFGDWMNFATNVFLANAYKEVIVKRFLPFNGKLSPEKIKELTDQELAKYANALRFDKIKTTSIYEVFGDSATSIMNENKIDYKASTVFSKVNSIRKEFEDNGIILTNDEVIAMLESTRVKIKDIGTGTTAGIVPTKDRLDVAYPTDIDGNNNISAYEIHASWWKTNASKVLPKSTPGVVHPITNGMELSALQIAVSRNDRIHPELKSMINNEVTKLLQSSSPSNILSTAHTYTDPQKPTDLDRYMKAHNLNYDTINRLLGF